MGLFDVEFMGNKASEFSTVFPQIKPPGDLS